MKAMILAAGRGERMRPLTEHTPKPLLKVAGKPLLEYQLERLLAAGIKDVVINIAYLGQQIRDYFGAEFVSQDNKKVANIYYSEEPEPLETAGAIVHALPLLGEEPFLLVNGDIWTDYPFAKLLEKDLGEQLGHLVLLANPAHNPQGDFSIAKGLLTEKNTESLTFSGISLLSPKLISTYSKRRTIFPLGEVFRDALARELLSAELFSGQWWDIGTVDRLNALDEQLSL